MVEPSARIRPFEVSDEKQVKFAIGKGNLESLAVANRSAYIHPLVLSLWIGLSCILVQAMHWWPKPEFGFWGYLSPLPVFASMAVPILFLIDWLNRPYFETLTQDTLRRPDVVDIKSYYSRSPASGFYILEYGDRFVGLVALDASLDSECIEPAKGKVSTKKGTSRVASIRHLYVEDPFRGIDMQKDLLQHAVQHALRASSAIQSIKAADSPLIPYVRDCLRSAGFQLQKHTQKVGVFGWNLGERILERGDWEKAPK